MGKECRRLGSRGIMSTILRDGQLPCLQLSPLFHRIVSVQSIDQWKCIWSVAGAVQGTRCGWPRGGVRVGWAVGVVRPEEGRNRVRSPRPRVGSIASRHLRLPRLQLISHPVRYAPPLCLSFSPVQLSFASLCINGVSRCSGGRGRGVGAAVRGGVRAGDGRDHAAGAGAGHGRGSGSRGVGPGRGVLRRAVPPRRRWAHTLKR
ncbi:hypothetical protein BRADI_3g53497v3 [Brachypodium distachyon]|uniref:Uncharacterized protein n=1 Tax=Brachypodium distachyon TaxID=15368 RepID=A0A2K2D4X2_BRADI|nr:hypothetical protein BRADI_3g53497v3 [Brachypodium distachyon]